MTIDEYCDAAKARHGIRSDRQLAAKLGLSQPAVNNWRQRKTWPSDDIMIVLAALADRDPTTALIDLNIWRSHGPAIALYTRIRDQLNRSKIWIYFLVAGCLTVQAFFPQETAAKDAYFVQPVPRILYIMENYYLLLAMLFLHGAMIFLRVVKTSLRPIWCADV